MRIWFLPGKGTTENENIEIHEIMQKKNSHALVIYPKLATLKIKSAEMEQIWIWANLKIIIFFLRLLNFFVQFQSQKQGPLHTELYTYCTEVRTVKWTSL